MYPCLNKNVLGLNEKRLQTKFGALTASPGRFFSLWESPTSPQKGVPGKEGGGSVHAN